MSQPRYLTKSRFKLAVECPTKLFYTGKTKVYRDTKQEDSFLQMLADGGYQVGELAKCQYPQGIEIMAIDHQTALAQTARLLQQEQVVLFEAALAHQDYFVRVDILVKDGNRYWMAETYMRREMVDWRYPYHFIDFETSSVAIPFHRGMRPYEQVAFQFSHHVMHADGRIEHRGQFLLAEPGVFPNFEFARALKLELEGDSGTVFMWSHHENTILNRIAIQLEQTEAPPPDAAALIEFVLSLTKGGSRAMYDLCDLAKHAYFHVATGGSVSIKKVLPALMASSAWLRQRYAEPIYGAAQGIPSLNYQDFAWCPPHTDGRGVVDPYELLRSAGEDMLGEPLLSGQDPDAMVIAEGGAAATAYARLQFESLPTPSAERIKSALLRYCELDTLAMVMVVQGWQHELFGGE